MRRVLMIGTGGTIASRQSDHGLSPGISSEELLSYVPQVSNVCKVDTVQICSVDSTDITPEHWKLMVETIQSNYEKYDGFVICHGTDTLAYTAAALSYMIQNSSKPIVITGSQKPIDMEITDAKTNLLDSFVFAADPLSQGVDVVFDGKVIMGTRAKKVQSKSYNAFTSINFPYHAIVEDMRVIRYVQPQAILEEVKFYVDMHDSVYLLKMIPGIQAGILSYVFDHYDCVIIESYGVGGMPSTVVDEFYRQMEKPRDKQKIVVMTTQVANEGSNMSVYQVGGKVKKDFNMLEAYDMTLEATVAKLMWIMAQSEIKTYEEIEAAYYKQINHDTMYTK